MRDLVLYIATSIDGFIADPAGDPSRFPASPELLGRLFADYPETCPVHLRDALGVSAEPRRFDTVLMGRRTYAPAEDAGLEHGAYPHLRQIVVTHGTVEAPGVEVVAGDVAGRVAALKAEPGRDIWLCGGADLAGQLIELVDEIQLKIYPVLLGDGIPLLQGAGVPRDLDVVDLERLPGGVALATYRLGPREGA
ncbi:dihydrofolate reductase family protein [Patulibacter americanus]|uniref:dihydrofolate reductase family protein n=1 Tax=Patulibacter americanus TaxID=588672 RepID=UPI0003B448CD|nr:dihydrofolate reductase family protein [Patulibacter americanus]